MVLIQRKEYNILLLGQTGCGKSTFINAFLNYISFETIDDALRSHVKYCVPPFFEWNDPSSDDETKYHVAFEMSEDETERQVFGESGTQDVRCYLFNVGNIGIRFIDTPGFGDTLGETKDEQISENLLQFLTINKELGELHAILFVFKPNDTRMTIFFQYCWNHILSKLHKNASENICFLFTHTKATDYKPGSTSTLIGKKIQELPNANILYDKRNKFCVENDCIKYLHACFCYEDEAKFRDTAKSYYTVPWNRSSKECRRLIEYIKTLKPHAVEHIIAINKIGSCNRKLQAVLPEILKLIDKETTECRKLEKEMDECAFDMEKLKNALYKYTAVKRSGYSVVCRNRRCSKRENEESTVVCCANCKALKLNWCQEISMWKANCKKCGCKELDHVFTNTEPEVRVEKNQDVEDTIEDHQKKVNELKLLRCQQIINKMKYEAEKKYVEGCMEKLSCFLTKAAIFSNQPQQKGIRDDAESIGDMDNKIAKMLEMLSNLHMIGKVIKEAFCEQNIPQKNEKSYYKDPVLDSWKKVCEVDNL